MGCAGLVQDFAAQAAGACWGLGFSGFWRLLGFRALRVFGLRVWPVGAFGVGC